MSTSWSMYVRAGSCLIRLLYRSLMFRWSACVPPASLASLLSGSAGLAPSILRRKPSVETPVAE